MLAYEVYCRKAADANPTNLSHQHHCHGLPYDGRVVGASKWRTMTLSFFVCTLTAVDVNDLDAAPARRRASQLPQQNPTQGLCRNVRHQPP